LPVYGNPDPDIIVIIGIRMSDDKKNIVERGGVFYSKTDFGFGTALPGLARNGKILFKNTRRQIAG
jgi:hypothetical protein